MNNFRKKSLLLIDGHSHLYRSFYALPSLTNNKGDLCNAIYGVINQIKYLYIKYNPNQIIVTFDDFSENFRKKLFKDYKKNRPEMPLNLKSQMKPLIKIIKYSGIPLIIYPKVEADDVIGSLTFQAIKRKYNIIRISTNDKDMSQLVSSNVVIIHSHSGKILGPNDIEKKYGVSPKFITSLLALTGDASDNVPGVPGIGKKTATLLIHQFGSLKNIYDKLQEIKNSNIRGSKQIAINLKKNKTLAFLSLKLVTINLNIDIDISKKKLQMSKPNCKKLLTLFNNYQFYKWKEKLQLNQWFLCDENLLKNYNQPYSKNNNNYKIIVNEPTLMKWILKIRNFNIFAFLIEIDNIFINNSNILSITIALNPQEIIYVPINLHNEQSTNTIYLNIVLKHLKPLFEDPLKIKILQNLKLNTLMLKKFDIKILGEIHDILLTSYILYNKTYIKEYDTNIYPQLNIQSNNKEKNSIVVKKSDFFLKKMHKIYLLHLNMYNQLKQNKIITNILKNIDIPLTYIILYIESNGVLINNKILESYSKIIEYKLNTLQRKAYEIVGETFNLSSSKQSQTILFKKMKLLSTAKTKKGQLSTNEKVLIDLSKKHPLPLLILKYRSLHKIKSTYIDKLLQMQNSKTNRIHTSYQQTSTLTGRLSSINPNLQNIPIRTQEGKYIRKAFIAPKGYSILSADYSQIELRIMAHLSKDKKLIEAFSKNQDIHCLTASEIFNIDYKKITKDQRQIAKTINFSLIYGMSAFGLSKKLNISLKESAKYIENYFLHYTGVHQYILYTYKFAVENGFVYTLVGRKIYIPNIYSKNITIRKAAERASINAPMQGSAADIIKQAMINIYTYIKKNNIDHIIKMIIQVHDELIFEIESQSIKSLRNKIKHIMENSTILNVPLKVNFGIGDNWYQASC
ncbi:DNA polymerase I [Buchnera aphidicola (Nipponaphis monzeni)]|uniref:DNA polymerase I n=1 Tax=Buchnera aphidicola (Nipponaphis monzeni) TaxID=2495405 RepID=A0A455TAI7_9GAMM|nr:DNA polymerase I [Buchnera aphidicola]BBI01328.1 DNA polymerase I [Buchnera aphidicola (Nipponaphis monzeni)]